MSDLEYLQQAIIKVLDKNHTNSLNYSADLDVCFGVFDNGAIKGGGGKSMISPELLALGDWGVSHGGLHLKIDGPSLANLALGWLDAFN